MERLTRYFSDWAHGAEGVSDKGLTGAYCRGKFEATAMVDRLAAIEDILGDDYDLDRLRELVEADRGGRCAVLPCKPGDTVWLTVRRGIYCVERWSVYQIYRRDGGGWYFRLKNMMLSQKRPNEFEECTRAISAFGKTMFLDREAAEQALKEWKDG